MLQHGSARTIDDDLTPVIVEGKQDEWSYDTALRLGGMLSITTGLEPVVARG